MKWVPGFALFWNVDPVLACLVAHFYGLELVKRDQSEV